MVNAERTTPAVGRSWPFQPPRDLIVLALLAALSAGLYAAVAVLSRRFEYSTPTTERPILLILLLLAATFAIYLFAIRIAARTKQDRKLLAVVAGSAVAFRLILLPSTPVQEIDIYRYLWDGAVLRAGVSPFRFSPQQVRQATIDESLPEDLERLVRLRDTEPSLRTILDRIHYGQVPTVYPPVSQLAFAAAAWTTPDEATVDWRIAVMKFWMIAWDLATFVLVLRLLLHVGCSPGLCLIYGWCPLLIKEVANSGHLDALAVFLTTLSVYLLVRLVAAVNQEPASPGCSDERTAGRGAGAVIRAKPRFLRAPLLALSAAAVLALAVGAKLYPVILAPLLVVIVAGRLGTRWSLAALTVFLVTTGIVLWPMLPTELVSHAVPAAAGQGGGATSSAASHATTSNGDGGAESAVETPDPSLGLQTFLRHWEMNEFLFLLVFENLKPTTAVRADEQAWFSIWPERLRGLPIAAVQAYLPVGEWEAAFWLARGVTALAFIGLAIGLLGRAGRTTDPQIWLECVFLTIAWFWLLAPTQNPWYWTWALPLLPFARGRAWLALSGLVLLYYLRFWLRYHFPAESVLGTPYRGEVFFDLVVTWLEYAPWLVCLGSGWLLRHYRVA